MASRLLAKQIEHDNAVVRIAKSCWSSVKGRVYTNPDSQRNCSVKYREQEVYPDIVAVAEESNMVQFVGEVETAETVTEAEAPQWKLYAKLGSGCHLYVPRGMQAAAMSLLRGVAGVTVWHYSCDASGSLTVARAT